MKKLVYSFSEGNKNMREILGGKGANLSEMINLGLPVPDGFIVTTEACNDYYSSNRNFKTELKDQILEKVKELEIKTNKKFGGKPALLLSVRSGGRASMPGMMDTILNLGMNDEVAVEMLNATKNPRFVYDSYRRFISMYADVVMGYSKDSFETEFDNYKVKKNLKDDQELTSDDLKEIVNIYKKNFKKLSKNDFPTDVYEQLINAIEAVFKSWNNPRAITYRKMNNIPDEWGTAVNIQEMVYGNNGEFSGTGVAFSRNPSTGVDELYGEYMINAQGEDLVAGIRTPLPISKLQEIMPDIYNQFYNYAKLLERHYKDMQDMEFTVDNKKLYILQTRTGKRTINAALKIAVELVNEGLISKKQALLSLNPNQLDTLLHETFSKEALNKVEAIAKGLPASPGAASGKIYFTAIDATLAKEKGEQVILVREETSPEDIEGMDAAVGILTVHGGMTSHAAVVARGMGKCCITGCSEISVDYKKKTLKTSGGITLKEGNIISLDGSTGYVYNVEIERSEPVFSDEFNQIMTWSKEFKKLGIRANADNELNAKSALEFGAEGIGLCRTEHMFFMSERILEIRKMIITDDEKRRAEALNNLKKFQKSDYDKLFKVMNGMPVTIRFIDPPLHEFLPTKKEDLERLSKELDMSVLKLKARINEIAEINPMMGHRGCRLLVTYPEILRMQTSAIAEAAVNSKKKGIEVEVEMMIPLISDIGELTYLKEIIIDEVNKVIDKAKVSFDYKIGTMIEVPRASFIADEIAAHVDFFSYGTNDLTQLTYGFSRDDAGKFLNYYLKNEVIKNDPFSTLDKTGVGELVKMATIKGRSVKENLKLGICGEHGGEPASIKFCHDNNLDYVSCSPYRIPIAILAAAQASLISEKDIEIIDVLEDDLEKINNHIKQSVELVKKYGFKLENSKVDTDGYYQILFKIYKK